MAAPRTLFAGVAAVALTLVPACGRETSAADARAEQVREVAIEAGLTEDVAEVLALAARGSLASFRVSYAGRDGAEVVVAQAPPNQRVDVVAAGEVVESRVRRDTTAYLCRPDSSGDLDCERAAGDLDVPGAFTEQALDAFANELAASLDTYDLTVESRTLADTEATCLVAAPRPGTPLGGDGPSADTMCLSPEGAQLLVDSGDERLVADTYTTDVPDGTFDV